MSTCNRCGFPIYPPGVAYAGMTCRCWAHYTMQPPAQDGARESKPLTEADVRRIVREELAAEKEENRRKMRAFIAEVHGAGDDQTPG
jgi:hypothetical protein